MRRILCLACWLALPAVLHADPIYLQPASFALGGYASQNAPNAFGPYYTAFDDFRLGRTSRVEEIAWQGSYSSPDHAGITGFTLGIWADGNDLPGRLLRSYDIAGDAAETFVESRGSFAAYEYHTRLPLQFQAEAGTTYWLSIQPTVDFPPQWFWREGTGGNGRSAHIIQGVSSQPRAGMGDSAFALVGSPVPEPSTVILLTMGLVAVARPRIRRTLRRERPL